MEDPIIGDNQNRKDIVGCLNLLRRLLCSILCLVRHFTWNNTVYDMLQATVGSDFIACCKITYNFFGSFL